MRDFSPMDTGTEYESSSSEDEDGLEVHPTSSADDDLGYQPSDLHSSSEEDESICVRRRSRKTKKHVETHGGLVMLKRHHLGSKGLCQLGKHGHALGKNFGKGKERCKDAQGTMLIAQHNDSNRIARVTRASARRKSSHHLEMALACMLKFPSPSRKLLKRDREPETYTFADAFCGAGGVSIAAREAGLHLAWAFDKDRDAVNTYNGNHDTFVCERISAQDFPTSSLANKYKALKVDILHLSPPYQGFSRAARGRVRNEAEDNECMTSVRGIVERVKPRIVTFEEVRGVLSRHQHLFQAMVPDLTITGYSVRWRVLECADYGVPQRRKCGKMG